MKALMGTLGSWATTVGAVFVGSLITQGLAKQTLAEWEAQGTSNAALVIILQIISQPPLILLIGFVGFIVILGIFLVNEGRGLGRW